ncbi:MAG: hypothetical protein ACRCWQ_02185 [Bacilli bacterium]
MRYSSSRKIDRLRTKFRMASTSPYNIKGMFRAGDMMALASTAIHKGEITLSHSMMSSYVSLRQHRKIPGVIHLVSLTSEADCNQLVVSMETQCKSNHHPLIAHALQTELNKHKQNYVNPFVVTIYQQEKKVNPELPTHNTDPLSFVSQDNELKLAIRDYIGVAQVKRNVEVKSNSDRLAAVTKMIDQKSQEITQLQSMKTELQQRIKESNIQFQKNIVAELSNLIKSNTSN